MDDKLRDRSRHSELMLDDVQTQLRMERGFERVCPAQAVDYLGRRITALAKLVAVPVAPDRAPLRQPTHADVASIITRMFSSEELVGWGKTYVDNDEAYQLVYDEGGVITMVIHDRGTVAIAMAPYAGILGASFCNSPSYGWPELGKWSDPPSKGLIGRLLAFARPDNPVKRQFPVIFTRSGIALEWASINVARPMLG